MASVEEWQGGRKGPGLLPPNEWPSWPMMRGLATAGRISPTDGMREGEDMALPLPEAPRSTDERCGISIVSWRRGPPGLTRGSLWLVSTELGGSGSGSCRA